MDNMWVERFIRRNWRIRALIDYAGGSENETQLRDRDTRPRY
jgi:hypothetical protein